MSQGTWGTVERALWLAVAAMLLVIMFALDAAPPLPRAAEASKCLRNGGDWEPVFVRKNGEAMHACVKDGELLRIASE